MNRLFFLASLVSIACLSCKAKKEANKIPDAPTLNETKQNSDSSVTYRLVISFISKGAGPDDAKRTELLKYLESHPKKPTYETVLWGREGEYDLCFGLSELKTKAEITAFIDNVKKIGNGSDMMQISENVVRPHNGR